MKTTRNFVLSVVLFLTVAACDEEGTTSSSLISTEEAADMVATTLAESSSGLTVSVTEATATAASAELEPSSGGRKNSCGYSESKSFSTVNRNGSVITFSYDFSYDYLVSCNDDNQPILLASEVYFDGSFDAPRLSSTHTGTGDLNVSALDETATTYRVNGSYSRSGSFESKIRNKNTSNSTVLVSIEEIIVDGDNTITEGTATVNINGEVPGKGEFTYSASIEFEGGNEAKLTIDGTIYTINLESGEIDQ